MTPLGEGLTYEYGSLLAAGASIAQSHHNHQHELARARERHALEVSLAKDQHTRSMVEAKRSYLLEIFYDLEQHFQQLNADLIASGNASERDMFDQRNQNFQTIILASSVMFTGLSTAIVDGTLPASSPEWVVVAFALTAALSFFFLFICVVMSIELVSRSSNFMYRRARRHATNLKKAIRETRELMHELNDVPDASGATGLSESERPSRRSNSGLLPAESSLHRRSPDAERSEPDRDRRQSLGASSLKKRVIDMDAAALREEWRKHESVIQKFLVKREFVNDRIAVVDLGGSSSAKTSFQEFWRTSCRRWEYATFLFFYLGTVNLLLCIMVFMWAAFSSRDKYDSQPAAIFAVTVIGAALVLGSAVIFYMRCEAMGRTGAPAAAHDTRRVSEVPPSSPDLELTPDPAAQVPVPLVSEPSTTSFSSARSGDDALCSCCA